MTIRDMDAFMLAGIEIRTTNAAEMTGEGLIPRQWERFMREEMAGRIPHRIDDNILAVYTEYARDEHAEYSFLLGARVSSEAGIPDGMTLKRVPAGRYWVLTSERGPVWRVVPETWKRVWENSPGTVRSFQADFEIYDQRAANPENAVVEIWVGLR